MNSYWGNGYANEAVKAILDFGFCTVGFICINAKIMKENVPSVRLASAVGMECDGLLRNGVYCKGEPHDVYVFSMLDTDYQKIIDSQNTLPIDQTEQPEQEEIFDEQTSELEAEPEEN